MIKTAKKVLVVPDGTSIYYETYVVDDRAPKLFFVHGVGGDLDAWTPIRDTMLAQGISCIAMDLRGHGYSGHPRGSEKYTLRAFAEDIQEVLKTEGLRGVVLVGHSFGAVIALHAAMQYPVRIEKLVVISGTYRAPDYISSRAIMKASQAFITAAGLVSPPPINPGHSTYPAGKHHKEYEPYGLFRTIMRNSWGSYLLSSKEMMSLSIKKDIAKIRIPTLVVVGENDGIFPVAHSRILHEQIVNSQFEVIPGGNHVIVLNNVPEVSAALLRFIQQQP
jgi:3-oxoadipate enol-lactonase